MIRIFSVPKIVSGFYSKKIWRIPSSGKSIYLTFDDGPTLETTEWILNLLNKYQAKATFFCVGENASRYPDLMVTMKENGHSLGNHTNNHLNGMQTDDIEYLKNVLKCAEVIDSKLFRPPYGRMKSRQAKEILKQHFKIIMWSVLSYDFDQRVSPSKIFKRITRQTKPGCIVVFHDNVKAMDNLSTVLPNYLAFCKEKGYEFRAL